MNEADQRKTVLLVDDAPANIQVVTSILKDIYKIRFATNGALIRILETGECPLVQSELTCAARHVSLV